jgi:hypothetical protein
VGATLADGVTVTCVSEATLAGANVTDAFESELEIVPPVVGETTAGGDRPLAVLAFGSGAAGSVPLGVVESALVGVDAAGAPTRTVIVPGPELAGAEAGGVAAFVPELPVVAVLPVVLESVVAGVAGVVVSEEVTVVDVEVPVPAPVLLVAAFGSGVVTDGI